MYWSRMVPAGKLSIEVERAKAYAPRSGRMMAVSESLWKPSATLSALVEKSKRPHLPLRKSFVQADDGSTGGPLARFVSSRAELALDLYLLSHLVASRVD